MNIFVTDTDPYKAAPWLDDKRLNKMTIETVQLLSHALGGPYKLTHRHHPCVAWVLADDANLLWLLHYLAALDAEYKSRFNKRHLSALKLEVHYPPFKSLPALTPNKMPSEFCNCTPFKDLEVTLAYQACLNEKWDTDVREPRWTRP